MNRVTMLLPKFVIIFYKCNTCHAFFAVFPGTAAEQLWDDWIIIINQIPHWLSFYGLFCFKLNFRNTVFYTESLKIHITALKYILTPLNV
ncbi:hypothetical protein DXN05_18245 [Deminuibacter soli]|uniref:Uncharacterized protein n=1 Tax=Deminuibacter soli TaxID=2291815 RepID=A0A3E1NG37_9BACT|nr:hypothetical protein DXN05_18245 [Deminuibacter soli]